MDNQPKQPVASDSTPASALGFQLRKGLDRIGFEADRLMRANRIRAEANRLRDRADERIAALGRKVIELSQEGAGLEPELQTLVSEIKALEAELLRKKREVEAVSTETWIAPPAPPQPAKQVAQPGVPNPQQAQLNPPATHTVAPSNEDRECPACHAPVRPQAAFCAQCGYKMAAA